MADYGLTTEGFVAPRTADLLEMIRDDYEAATELEIDWEADVFLGQITASMASIVGDSVEGVVALVDALDPENAVGVSLANMAALHGITPRAATFSQVYVTLTGEAGTTISAGNLVSSESVSGIDRWVLMSDATLLAATMTTGDLTFVDGGANPGTISRQTGSWIDAGVGVGTQITITSTASNNLTFTVSQVLSASEIEVQQGVVSEAAVAGVVSYAVATVLAQAEYAGAVSAGALEINTIATPVKGWQGVSNPLAAATGSEDETSSELRTRRTAMVFRAASGSVEAVRARLLALDFLTSAIVIENDSIAAATVQGVSLPAKSISAFVYPSVLTAEQQNSVLEVLWTAKAGIECYGTDVVSTVTATDGTEQPVAFNYAVAVAVAVTVTVTTSPGYTTAQVESDIESAVQTYFNSLGVADPARELALKQTLDVPGVVGATVLFDGSSADLVPTAIQRLTLGSVTVV